MKKKPVAKSEPKNALNTKQAFAQHNVAVNNFQMADHTHDVSVFDLFVNIESTGVNYSLFSTLALFLIQNGRDLSRILLIL